MKAGPRFSLRQFNLGIELVWLLAMLLLISAVFVFNYQQQRQHYYTIATADAARVEGFFQQRLDSIRDEFTTIALTLSADANVTQLDTNSFTDFYALDDKLQISAIYQRAAGSFVFDRFSFASGNLQTFLAEALPSGGFSSFMRGYEDDHISLYYAARINGRNYLARVNLQAFQKLLNNYVLFADNVLLVTNQEGVVVFTTHAIVDPANFTLRLDQPERDWSDVRTIAGQDWLPIIITSSGIGSTLVSLVPVNAFQQQLNNLRWTSLGIFALLLILLLLKNAIASRFILKPLARIANNLARIEADYTQADIQSPGKNLPHEFASIDSQMRDILAVLQQREQALQAAAAQMAEQQQKLETILNALPVGIAITTPDEPRTITFINAQFTASFGYELTDIPTATDWFEQAYPDPEYRQQVFSRWYREVDRAKATSRYVSFMEFVLACKDGSQRDVLFSAVISGEQLIVVLLDITSHNANERVIASYQAALQKTAYELTENIPVGTYTMILPPGDAVAHFGFASERFLELTGLTRQEAMENAMSAFRCVHPDDLARWVQLNSEAFTEKKHFYAETRLIVKGETRWITAESTPRELPDGTLIWEGVLIDVTPRKLLEQELAQSQAHLRRILENLPTPVALLELDTPPTISYLNHSFATLFGYSLDDVRKTNWLAHFMPQTGDAEALLERLQAQLSEQTQSDWHEYMVQKANGGFLQVMLGSMRVDNTLILTFVDVTSQREVELTLLKAKEKAEQLEQAKSDFLATMSHEIRTPLTIITGITQLLNQQQVTDQERVLLANLETASQSLLGIINDVLDLSKIDAGQLQLQHAPFNLTDLIEQMVALHQIKANEKDLLLTLHGSAMEPLRVMGDEPRCSQILQNLLSNAIKFTNTGGISIELTEQPIDADQIKVTISVSDTGIGIAPDEQELLFKPFVQIEHDSKRRFAGSGLGLAITQRLVDMIGGSITLDSAPNRGSCFTVQLPFARATSTAIAPPQAKARREPMQSLEGMQILVVDDSEIVMKLIQHVLESQGATAVVFNRAKPALEWLQANHVRCDLVLMDLQMPEMDGIEAIDWIRNKLQLADLPIYAFTAGVLQSVLERVFAVGVNDVLYKPVNLQQLVSILAQWHPDPAVAEPAEESPVKKTRATFPIIDGINSVHASNTMDGNRTLFADLVERFKQGLGVLSSQITADTQQGNSQKLVEHLHRLRGNSRMIGALDLSHAAAALEDAIRAGNTNLDALHAELDRQIQRLLPQSGSDPK